MSIKKTAITAAVVGAVATVGLSGPSQAADGTEHVLRVADVDLSETRATGHVDFLRDGLHVWTESNTSTDKAAGYFAIDSEFPTSAGLTWIGSTPAPGAQLMFDADNIAGNGNDYNLLVGESVYGDVWWLTPISSDDAKAADPSADQNGGYGSEWFGTLEEWKAALPEATAYAGGFSLGSGIKGEGVITEIRYDDDVYTFTSKAETVRADVTGSYELTQQNRKVKIVMTSDDQPANSIVGKRLRWVVKVDGHVAFRTAQKFDDRDVWARTFRPRSGRHMVQVFMNGDLVDAVQVRTRKK